MTISVETIKHIENGVAAEKLNGLLKEKGHETVIAAPDGVKIHDLEKYAPTRRRFTGTFTTSSFNDFIEYCLKIGKGETFINKEEIKANHFFDIYGEGGAPGHCDHKATLGLKKLAAFSALLSNNGTKLDQRGFCEFLQEWRDFITCLDDDLNAMPFERTISALKNMDIKQVKEANNAIGNLSAEKSILERVEATSKDVLPWGFYFECSPYDSLAARKFRLRLGVITSEKPQLFYRIELLEIHNEQIAQEFSENIKQRFNAKPGLVVLVGNFSL